MTEKPDTKSGDPSNASKREADEKAEQPKESTKTQDLAKAGRDDFDPNAGEE